MWRLACGFTAMAVMIGPSRAAAATGACCEPDTGACTVTRDDECLFPVFLPGASCQPSPCPPGQVACCLPYAECQLETPCRCTARGGVASQTGDGGCSPVVCVFGEFGACCLNAIEPACVITHREVCAHAAGVFHAAGAPCNPVTCPGAPFEGGPALQACCCVNQECVLSPPAVCVAGGGRPLTMSACVFAVCSEAPAGACCFAGDDGASVCQLHGQLVCAAFGGSFRGFASACESPAGSGNFTSCCRANFDGQNGIGVGDVFAYLVAYFSGSISADFDGVRGVTVGDLFTFLNEYFHPCR